MLHPLERRALRRQFSFETADDACRFVAEMAVRSEPGMAVAICLDHRRRLLDFRPVVDGADHLSDVLAFVDLLGDRRTASVLLLSDRTGDLIADRPDDELVWEELVGQADARGLTLIDWWILYGSHAFSIAEHAPTPARW